MIHMLRDGEGVLCSLQSQWSSIELQMAWKLESCLMLHVSEQISQNSHASGVTLTFKAYLGTLLSYSDVFYRTIPPKNVLL